MREKLKCLSGAQLKVIAIISMLIDHTGAAILELLPDYLDFTPQQYELLQRWDDVIRAVGRTSFPIFCFMLVEGYLHTHSKIKYLRNLALFAVLSEVPFDLAFFDTIWHPEYQNVFVTLLCGLLTLIGIDWCREKFGAGRIEQQAMAVILPLLAGAGTAYVLKCDYYGFGVILIVIFYLLRFDRPLAGVVGYLSFIWEPFSFPAFLLIQMYNGKRGRQLKYLFYIIYPAHLLILAGIRWLIVTRLT